MAAAIQDELLAVPGIAGAEVESERGFAGVRVQLATGADADAVGVAVRRILSDHGMRPTPAEGEKSGHGPPPPPGAPGSVVRFPLVGEHATANELIGTEEMAAPRLESVAVEETPDGMSVSVRSTHGKRCDRTLDSGIGGMDVAVVSAVAELIGDTDVSLAGLAQSELGGYPVITVLVAVDEDQYATGAAVQHGGRAYAVARATWTALSL